MNGLMPVRVVNKIGTIEDNLDAVETSIRKRVEEYGGMAVTEDTVKEGKQVLADMRKEKAALDNERKEIKSQWMKPYLAFEERAKKIIALYDEPIEAVSSQIKQYDALQKEEKRKKIQAVYDAVKGEYGDWLPLEKIYDAKWENKSYSPKRIKEDMERLFGQLEVSISTIKSMDSEFEADALHIWWWNESRTMSLALYLNRRWTNGKIFNHTAGFIRGRNRWGKRPAGNPLPSAVRLMRPHGRGLFHGNGGQQKGGPGPSRRQKIRLGFQEGSQGNPQKSGLHGRNRRRSRFGLCDAGHGKPNGHGCAKKRVFRPSGHGLVHTQ